MGTINSGKAVAVGGRERRRQQRQLVY